MQVLYEDNHLLLIAKPNGLATMGVEAGEESAWSQACQYLKAKYQKPGNVYLGVVSRLDAAVSGVLVFARTSKAAARLNEQFRETEVEKTYWAVVQGEVRAPSGHFEDWVRKNENAQRMEVVPPQTPLAKRAVLSYRVLRPLPLGTLLDVRLETGRKHQIRVQFASRRMPVLGDFKYGARRQSFPGIALHARCLRLLHPISKQPVEIEAPLPEWWSRLGVEA